MRLATKMNCEHCGHENIEGAHFCASCGSQLTQEDTTSWVGRTVGGRFKVNRVLGEGGMGIVYEGEQPMGSATRRVAIKTLHPHLSKDPAVLARFHRECGTVAQLMHPNTIKFYDFGAEADGTLYIAMEFLDGRSLDRVIEEEGALSPPRTLKILKQICGALDEAHDLGVVHRDLKPENVVLGERLGERDFVKVLDFGIAARSESADAKKEAKLTQQGMVLGTPPYMSPEQFTGEELDRRSDIYSLGVMTYEMLTGHLPFSANTPWQWATEHMTAQPFPIDQRPSGAAIPQGMRRAVMRALEKDPAARQETARAFLQDLEEGAAGLVALGAGATQEMQSAALFAATASMAARPSHIGAAAASSATGTQSEMSATQPIVIPQRKGSGPLVLAGIVGVLALAAGGVFALRSGSASPEPSEGTGGAAASQASEPQVVPTDKVEPGDAQAPAPSPLPNPGPATSPGPAPQTNPDPSPQPAPRPAPQPSPQPQPGPQPTPSPRPTPQPAPAPATQPDACEKCAALLRRGRWSEVIAVINQCNASTASQCRAAGASIAQSQVNAAVASKQCSRADSVVQQARRLGVATGALEAEARKCGN